MQMRGIGLPCILYTVYCRRVIVGDEDVLFIRVWVKLFRSQRNFNFLDLAVDLGAIILVFLNGRKGAN